MVDYRITTITKCFTIGANFDATAIPVDAEEIARNIFNVVLVEIQDDLYSDQGNYSSIPLDI